MALTHKGMESTQDAAAKWDPEDAKAGEGSTPKARNNPVSDARATGMDSFKDVHAIRSRRHPPRRAPEPPSMGIKADRLVKRRQTPIIRPSATMSLKEISPSD